MLILDRKDGESIIIENNEDVIEVTLFKDNKGRFRIGIDAPQHFNIVRKELLE